MSLDQAELKQHSDSILKSRRIKNKVVILCEGSIARIAERPSPQAYKRMEELPDANFYKACVPKWWTQYRPQFFNCGDRKDVLDTYFTLLEQHHQHPNDSYLHPDKLFAIVDLDNQVQKIEQNYSFQDTETIFYHLYQTSKVNENNARQHRIWVTGLIHKEAYCILPTLQQLFDNYHIPPQFQNIPLRLTDLYVAMSNSMDDDQDLQKHFALVCKRIQHCSSLNFQDVRTLKDSWQHEFRHAFNHSQKQELIHALLTVKKVKNKKRKEQDYWNQIVPASNCGWVREDHIFREQLLLEIGRFYANQPDNSEYHIPVFFRILSQLVNST